MNNAIGREPHVNGVKNSAFSGDGSPFSSLGLNERLELSVGEWLRQNVPLDRKAQLWADGKDDEEEEWLALQLAHAWPKSLGCGANNR